MITRLEIATRPEQLDARGLAVARKVRAFLELPVADVRTCDVYHVEAELAPGEAERVLHELVDPILQHGALGRLDHERCDVMVSVGYKPGVTDPVGKSARVAIEDTLGRPLGAEAAVYCSRMYLLRGADRAAAELIARQLLMNPIIHTAKLQSWDEWTGSPPDLEVPRVRATGIAEVETIRLDGDADALGRISRERLLALSVAELQAIAAHFHARQRAPTDVELECLAQTWSEHCKHKIFNATIVVHDGPGPPQTIDSLFSTFVRRATEEIDREIRAREGRSWLVSVFHDNAGAVAFDERVHLVYKVETHNSPSALDPYGGAITGIVGVNRDAFGTGRGAELLVNVWGYCFASPFHAGPLPAGLLHPRRVRDGVHEGVIDGGNQSGVPYGRGWELFDGRFLGKPLVFCGTVGALPTLIAGTPGEEKAARPGDAIVMCGGRIGADGIHGATFSSAELDETAPVQAVQIGDPITQKRMFDFLIEARDLGLYSAITDNGAGGLSSSVGEMAREPGGARLDLARAPLKYEGLAPWEILVSEAQERMTLAVPPASVQAFLALARRREVEATVLGEFTASGRLEITWGERVVGAIELGFLHGGNPPLQLEARFDPPRWPEPPATAFDDGNAVLLAMLRRLNLSSNEALARHYDHEVKGLTVIKPWVGRQADVPAEATVFLARHGSWRGFVLSEGVNPFLSDIDAHAMAQSAVDLALRRQLCAGARLDRVALLDNFCWPDPVQSEKTPDGAHKLAQLVRACRGLYEAARAYGTPLISGKDSMKNDSTMGGVKISVPPTLLVSALGQIDDARRAVTLVPAGAGEAVYVVGDTAAELGASEYFRHLGERDHGRPPLGAAAPYVGNAVPRLDPGATLAAYRALAAAMGAGLVAAAAAPALGGLALTFARMAIAGRVGLAIDLDGAPDLAALAVEAALYSESCGRFVLTAEPDRAAALADRLEGVPAWRVGHTTGDGRLRIRHGGRTWIDIPVAELAAAFRQTLTYE